MTWPVTVQLMVRDAVADGRPHVVSMTCAHDRTSIYIDGQLVAMWVTHG